MENEWPKEIEKLRKGIEKMAILCLNHSIISRGKFAEIVEIDRCDIDDFLKREVDNV